MPVKESDELKARGAGRVLHARAVQDAAQGATTRVADELGLSKEALQARAQEH